MPAAFIVTRRVPIGWGSYLTEDYVLQSAAFESQLLSLVSEGVFAKFPDLKVVFMEIGLPWLPRVFMARQQDLARRARRSALGQDDRQRTSCVDHVRFTVQPIDEPPDAGMLEHVLDQIGSDRYCCSRPTIRTGTLRAWTHCQSH